MAITPDKIDFTSVDFDTIKTELINFTRASSRINRGLVLTLICLSVCLPTLPIFYLTT
jgi:hypothetical protein